jgi:hypothetical protein
VSRAAPVHPGGAEPDRQCRAGVEIVDDDVQVRLLRVRRVSPARRVVAGHLLEQQALAVAGDE